ncbi:MAG: transposase domain-containing protein [Rhodobacter sp.]|nr:transposase domain-containing protein [Rhodobacter sp.]
MTQPGQLWWTASEIAAAGLPDLPGTRQGVERLCKAEDWRGQTAFARRRSGRGGGWEYHWRLFPVTARNALLNRSDACVATAKHPPLPRDQAWATFETLPEATRAKARQRLAVIDKIEALTGQGLTRQLAVTDAARAEGLAPRTIWNWLGLIEGIAPADRLAYLAPKHRAQKKAVPGRGVGSSNGADAPDSALDGDAQQLPAELTGFFDLLKADYLRLERPSFSASYRRAAEVAAAKGWALLPERSARRKLEATIPRVTRVLAREGVAGLERCFPPQIRDRSALVAMEGLNADCHKIDVFVDWEAGRILRPQIVAFQDRYSGKILSWRVDWTPNKVAVMAAFGDVVERYGIPRRCLFDNGREFANKWLTGGAKSRFRFRIREDDPLGVLAQLGIGTDWASPGRGQSKPVERAFRDWAEDIARDPRFAGAYVGHKPDAKPENYGSRAIPLSDFLAVVEAGIARHNARPGRRSQTCAGRSFDETFATSYATATVLKATEEQRRLWLMGQETRKLHRDHGRLGLYDNLYWSDWMNTHAGQKVIARFDPEDLHAGVWLYALDGSYLGHGACQAKTGFFDLASAREQASARTRRRREHRKLLEAARPKTVADIAAELDAIDAKGPTDASPVEAKIIRPAFGTRPNRMRRTGDTDAPARPAAAGSEQNGRGTGSFSQPSHGSNTADPHKVSPAVATRHEALIAEFKAPKRGPDETAGTDTDGSTPPETRYTRFRRALELEAAEAQGAWVGKAEAAWLRTYRSQPEYRAMRALYDDFGAAMLGD